MAWFARPAVGLLGVAFFVAGVVVFFAWAFAVPAASWVLLLADPVKLFQTVGVVAVWLAAGSAMMLIGVGTTVAAFNLRRSSTRSPADR
jgi:hypothetical protein